MFRTCKSLLTSGIAVLSQNELRRRAAIRAGFLLSKPARRLQVALSTKRLYGPINFPSGKPVVFCCFKNASYHLRAFVEHHLEMGFEHFVLLDNASTDHSLDIINAFKGITLYQSTAPFGTHQMEMREYLLDRHGRNRWCLQLDVDEHFRWFASKDQPLSALIRSLESRGWNAVIAQMVDTFGDFSPTRISRYGSDSPSAATLRERYPYFTRAGLIKRPYLFGTLLHRNTVSNPHIPCLYGGLRNLLFGTEDFLTKHPFFRYGGSVKPIITSSHTICGSQLADFTAILLHYKLVDNFYHVVRNGLASGSHINVESNYRRFQSILESATPSFQNIPKCLASDDRALLRAGFYQSIPDSHPFLAAHSHAPSQTRAHKIVELSR